jgi:hypothetical protein
LLLCAADISQEVQLMRAVALQLLVEAVKEGKSGDMAVSGRTDGFQMLHFPLQPLSTCAPFPGNHRASNAFLGSREPVPGDYVAVDVGVNASGRLIAEPLGITSLASFVKQHGSCNPGRVAKASPLAVGVVRNDLAGVPMPTGYCATAIGDARRTVSREPASAGLASRSSCSLLQKQTMTGTALI